MDSYPPEHLLFSDEITAAILNADARITEQICGLPKGSLSQPNDDALWPSIVYEDILDAEVVE